MLSFRVLEPQRDMSLTMTFQHHPQLHTQSVSDFLCSFFFWRQTDTPPLSKKMNSTLPVDSILPVIDTFYMLSLSHLKRFHLSMSFNKSPSNKIFFFSLHHGWETLFIKYTIIYSVVVSVSELATVCKLLILY